MSSGTLLGECLTTSGSRLVKLTQFSVNRSEVKTIRRQLAKVQQLRREHVSVEKKRVADQGGELERLVQQLPETTAEPALECLPSLFLPAAARHVFDDLLHDLATYVIIDLLNEPIPFPALFARSPAGIAGPPGPSTASATPYQTEPRWTSPSREVGA
jgi:hypothetical protein